MATPNRTALINKVLRVLRKHYKPAAPSKDRSLFENLLYACLLENSQPEAAEAAFDSVRDTYFDWNEVRVSTVRELSEVMNGLTDPPESAQRFKQTLHSVFESVYAFDMEHLKKQNIGQAAKLLSRLNGTTPFVVAYATQTSLGGHAIPVNRGLFQAFTVLGIVTEAEANGEVVPGLERAVPKSKGVEVGSLLHRLGVEVGRNPYGTGARKLLLEIDPQCKDRLPKRPTKRAAAASPETDGQEAAEAAADATTNAAAKAPEKKTTKSKQPTGGKKKAAQKPAKKPAKKAAKKKTTGKKKDSGRRITRQKPK